MIRFFYSSSIWIFLLGSLVRIIKVPRHDSLITAPVKVILFGIRTFIDLCKLRMCHLGYLNGLYALRCILSIKRFNNNGRERCIDKAERLEEPRDGHSIPRIIGIYKKLKESRKRLSLRAST